MKICYPGLLSRSLQSTFQQQLENKLRLWIKAWFVEGELQIHSLEFNNKLFAATTTSLQGHNILFSTADIVCFTEHKPASLAQQVLVADENNPADQTFSQFIADKMSRQLLDSLTLVGAAEMCQPECFDRACRIEFCVLSVPMTLLFSAAYLYQFAKLQGGKSKTRFDKVSLKQMVAEQKVAMSVSLQSRSISVSQLLSLEVGHVIPLQQSIKAPLPISSESNQPLMQGYLVKQANNKAIYLTGNTK